MSDDAIELAEEICDEMNQDDRRKLVGERGPALITLARAVLSLSTQLHAMQRANRALQDDLLQRDETLALIERDEPVRSFFALANVMREVRDGLAKIAALTAERDQAVKERNGMHEAHRLVTLVAVDRAAEIDRLTARIDALRAALLEACTIADRVNADAWPNDVARIAELRALAEGSE